LTQILLGCQRLVTIVILKDKRKLDAAYVPGETPCREQEKKRLMLLLESGKALISGEVGTGKTLLAKHTDGDVYVNCYTHKSEHKVLEEILRITRPKFSTAGLTGQRLWRELQGEHLLILDEIDGMIPQDLTHFAYTLSRHEDLGTRLRYVATTRSALMLKQLIHDDATWSTFAEKAVVELEPYTRDQMMEILSYRARDSLGSSSYDEDVLYLIADIAQVSTGHMRSGIDVLRNAALVADQHGHTSIEPEDVREGNRESWLSALTELDEEQLLMLLAVAIACHNAAYADGDLITKEFAAKAEEYGVAVVEKDARPHLDTLANHGFVYPSDRGFTLIDCPAAVLVKEIERLLNA
jgi:Cdc6-like AAA superfamily ATPase